MISSSNKPTLAEALSAARDTRILEIGTGVLNKTPDIFRRQFGDRTAVVVADSNTFAIAGRKIIELLQAVDQPCRQPFIFSDSGLYAEHNRVTELEASLKQHDAIPIAVGSGTINDLTKLAAHCAGRSYLCVATAASMDGYTAYGASITYQGSKQTFDCPAPAGVIADLDIICAASGDMNAWGYADLLAKVTAGADWLLADALGIEPIQPQPWNIAQGRLRELLSDPAGVRARQPEAVRQLTEGLMLGGFAMQAARTSRAASGAEHQFSHLWDMQHHTYNGKAPSHGFKVGIGTLAATALYEYLLAQPIESLDVERCCAEWPDAAAREKLARELFDDAELIEVALRESRAKEMDSGALRLQLEELRGVWPALRKRLGAQLMSFAELKKTLQTIGAPVEPEQIGISRTRLRDSFRQAFFIRRRFTVLDLAFRIGELDAALADIFGASGPFNTSLHLRNAVGSWHVSGNVMPNPHAPAAASRGQFPGWLRFFAPAPVVPALTDPGDIERGFRRWRWRVLFSSIIGYAIFYFVRNNLPVAMPVMEKTLGISKSQLGIFLTLNGILYGISKLANGFYGDRCNARSFMVVGLLASAALNVIFGCSSAVIIFGLVWMLNGWFQGMGFPPCARLLTHWFPPRELATKMSVWNTSHCLGAIGVLILCGQLVVINWRLCFWVPAAMAGICACFLWLTLPDTPSSVGLPEVPGTQTAGAAKDSGADFSAFLRDPIFRNKYIWLFSLANFFVYTLRYSVFDWGVTLLTESRHVSIGHAIWLVVGFEVAGLVGALVAGWLTDRFFGGRVVQACVAFMVLAGISILLFWKVAGDSKLLNLVLLCASGFFIYGPQCLIGIAVANLATKRAAATAVGLTGLFGYFSKTLSGVGLGTLVEHYGWDAGFVGLVVIAAIGTMVFILAWPAKAHGYELSSTGSSTATDH